MDWDSVAHPAVQAKYPLADPEQIRRNAYRVLLTGGRDGLVVSVPPDTAMDHTEHALLAAGVRPLPSRSGRYVRRDRASEMARLNWPTRVPGNATQQIHSQHCPSAANASRPLRSVHAGSDSRNTDRDASSGIRSRGGESASRDVVSLQRINVHSPLPRSSVVRNSQPGPHSSTGRSLTAKRWNDSLYSP